MVNKCRRTVWPGLLSGANSPPLPTTGFELKSGKSRTITIPKSWSGRIWARTLCTHHQNQTFSCVTGDCGSQKLECAGSGAAPPATLAEFTLNGAGGLDFYDVSLVDGYNLPMLVVPKGGRGGGCGATGCLVDLNGACPAELKVAREGRGGSVACKSACEAFGDPRYCCSEAYATPDTCFPSVYSLFFKHVCPRAYSYAYDDKTSTYTCGSADYVIIFCPAPYTRWIYSFAFIFVLKFWVILSFHCMHYRPRWHVPENSPAFGSGLGKVDINKILELILMFYFYKASRFWTEIRVCVEVILWWSTFCSLVFSLLSDITVS